MTKIRTAAFVAALAVCAILAGCETATPYQPLSSNATTSGGFTDQKLENDRYLVTFAGNTLTSRETVESYLLYRAAELTLAQGFDVFEMVDRHTDRDRSTFVGPDPYFGAGYQWGYWRPSWRYYGGGFGRWRAWNPYFGGPFWADGVDVETVQKYEASAEIVMRHGPRPPGSARVLDARQVMANLAGKIHRPS